MKTNKNKKGFTLIELLIVLVIMAIVTAIAVPSISGYTKAQRNKNCKTEMNALADEIRAGLSSKRFSQSTDLKQDVYDEIKRLCLNHVEGASVTDGTVADGDIYNTFELSNVCTSGGIYEVKWKVNTTNANQVGISKLSIHCDKQTSVYVDPELTATVTVQVESPAITAEEYVVSVAKDVCDKIADYVTNLNLKNDTVDTSNPNNDCKNFLNSTLGNLYTPNTTSRDFHYGTRENLNQNHTNGKRYGNSMFCTGFSNTENIRPYSDCLSEIKFLSADSTIWENEKIYGISLKKDSASGQYYLYELIYSVNYKFNGTSTPIKVKMVYDSSDKTFKKSDVSVLSGGIGILNSTIDNLIN
jgi:prepilin-type N-terminal cleavage/methylation domain-containing protein